MSVRANASIRDNTSAYEVQNQQLTLLRKIWSSYDALRNVECTVNRVHEYRKWLCSDAYKQVAECGDNRYINMHRFVRSIINTIHHGTTPSTAFTYGSPNIIPCPISTDVQTLVEKPKIDSTEIQKALFNTVVERMRRVHGPFDVEPVFETCINMSVGVFDPCNYYSHLPFIERIEMYINNFNYNYTRESYNRRNTYRQKAHLLKSLATKRSLNYTEDMLNTYLNWSVTYQPTTNDNRYERMNLFLDTVGHMF